MASHKEEEIISNKEIVTREQKRKTANKKFFKPCAPKTSDNENSKICIGNDQSGSANAEKSKDNSPNDGSKNSDNKLTVDEFMLPENKKSLGNKPFTIIIPGREPIQEKIFETKINFPIESEDMKTVPNGVKRDEISNCEDIKDELVSKKGKILTITVVESSMLQVGTIFTMNKEGLEESKRNKKDGHAFFGRYNGDDIKRINDYNFPLGEEGYGQRHFEIYYNKTKDKYFLRDLGDGTGTFLKIIKKKVMTVNMIVSFHSIHLSISINEKKSAKNCINS